MNSKCDPHIRGDSDNRSCRPPTACRPPYPQVKLRFRRWWQVLGSNQRWLSRQLQSAGSESGSGGSDRGGGVYLLHFCVGGLTGVAAWLSGVLGCGSAPRNVSPNRSDARRVRWPTSGDRQRPVSADQRISYLPGSYHGAHNEHTLVHCRQSDDLGKYEGAGQQGCGEWAARGSNPEPAD